MMTPEPLLSKAEARKVLGIARVTFDRMIRRGDIPVIPVSPRRVLIDPADLRAFIVERKETRLPPSNDTDPAGNRVDVRTSAGAGGGDAER